MSVYELGKLRIVDLSKYLDPATETRRCHLYRFNTGGRIPDFHTIMDLTSHLGTHCECPYHHDDNWPDASSLPLSSFMGRCVYITLKSVKPNTHISAKDLDRECAGLVKEGDVLILDSPYKLEPFTDKTNGPEDKRLLVNGETAQWMVDHKIKSVGFGDGVSIESSNEDVKPFHDVCMAHNITFIEVLKNLDKLRSQVFFISFAPMYIKGLDSCPVRAYAIEGLEEFR
ncbi:MAG: cyclase family protein [Sphaerochaetaceae bacterium]|jgi:arylformamidase|nr:cyclase family protein [Sphaerochaetaceae bacterium]